MSETAPTYTLQTQINDLRTSMEKNFNKLEAMIRDYENRVRAVETREASCQPLVEQRLADAFNRINEQANQLKKHDERLDKLESLIIEQRQFSKLVAWIGAPVGLAIIADLMTRILQ